MASEKSNVAETVEAEGENVKLSGFGVFVVADKAPRMGRNPQMGGEIVIGARRVVRFKASPVLRGEVNGQ
jgi:integration host factor subunit alpha